MRGLGWAETLTESLFNNLNQVIRVGACWMCSMIKKIISLASNFVNSRVFCKAEPSLGFSQNPISI